MGFITKYIRSVLLALLAALIYLKPAGALALEVDCDSDYVSVVGAEIHVAPTGADDTENIECALNEAVRLGVQKVKLEGSTYTVSSIIGIYDFQGQFEGRTRDSTIISLADQSFECTSREAPGAGLVFAVGAPSVKFMTFQVASPCTSSTAAFTVLAFISAPEDCSRRTLFGNVDRVNFLMESSASYEVRAVSTGRGPNCPSDLPALGTFKLNRSLISGLPNGLFISMAAEAQVDVNFNTFSQTEIAVYITNANQNTTVTGNEFRYGGAANPVLALSAGVVVDSFQGAPDINRTVVHNNRFFDAGLIGDSYGVLIAATGNRVNHSVVISSNRFEFDGVPASGLGVGVWDVDGGTAQNNTFVGSADYAVIIGPLYHEQAVTDWAIFGNNVSDFDSLMDADIFLADGTTDSYVGPQGASVEAPDGNFIAPQD